MSRACTEPTLQIHAPQLRHLYDDWQARRRSRSFPSRSDFDPLELKYILGYLSLIEVKRDPVQFIFRLHASNNAERINMELTGKDVAFLPNRHDVVQHFNKVLATGLPILEHFWYRSESGRAWEIQVLTLPLATDGKTIDVLMSGLAWTAQ